MGDYLFGCCLTPDSIGLLHPHLPGLAGRKKTYILHDPRYGSIGMAAVLHEHYPKDPE
jgi:hypothetical protein